MSIRIYQINDNLISMYQARYVTSITVKYLDTASTKVYKTIIPYDMIFTKYDTSTSDEKVDKFTREFSIHY